MLTTPIFRTGTTSLERVAAVGALPAASAGAAPRSAADVKAVRERSVAERIFGMLVPSGQREDVGKMRERYAGGSQSDIEAPRRLLRWEIGRTRVRPISGFVSGSWS